jgi:hypothetical protein
MDSTTSADTYFSYSPPVWLTVLIPLARHHHQANIILGVSVMILASIIRLAQVAPLAEVSFIDLLAAYELFITTASFATMFYIFDQDENGSGHLFFSSLYAAFLFSGFVAAISMKKFPSSKSQVLKVITDYCIWEKDYPVPDVSLEDSNSTFEIIFWPTYFGVMVVVCALLWYFRSALARFATWLENQFKCLCRWLNLRPRRTVAILAIFGMGGYWSVSCTLFLLMLQKRREALRQAVGSAYPRS